VSPATLAVHRRRRRRHLASPLRERGRTAASLLVVVTTSSPPTKPAPTPTTVTVNPAASTWLPCAPRCLVPFRRSRRSKPKPAAPPPLCRHTLHRAGRPRLCTSVHALLPLPLSPTLTLTLTLALALASTPRPRPRLLRGAHAARVRQPLPAARTPPLRRHHHAAAAASPGHVRRNRAHHRHQMLQKHDAASVRVNVTVVVGTWMAPGVMMTIVA